MIGRLTIIGVGLIGGSLALALRQAGACREVVGCSRKAEHLQRAVELGVIDRYELDPARAVEGADLVLVAVPLGAMRLVFEAMRPGLVPNTVVTDVGSAKASVVADARAAWGELPPGFVPGHPIAGTEKSGVEAAFPTLYQGRRVIITPLESSSAEAVARVKAAWEVAGAVIETMSVEHHDEILAATSHLPHMLAFGLVDSLARMRDNDEIFRYAAGGFRDFTRIASSDPVMWRDICLANRGALLDMMGRYKDDLRLIEAAIEQGDGDALLEIFTRAKAARDRFCG
jgi:prephenate dehydrogenase